MASLDFNPLDFFREEIKNDVAAIRIEAIANVNLIAHALGPQRTVNELIPYLITAIEEDPFKSDEEFLCKVATGLGTLREFMNGTNIDMLIPPLELLAAQEETVIRHAAVESLCAISKAKPDLARTCLIPCLYRLATKTDFFTARVSACAIFPTAYMYADEDQKAKLRKSFVAICSDETPMVRRAAASGLSEFAQACERNAFLEDIIGAFKLLAGEETQDTIRVSAVHATIVLAQKFEDYENLEHTIQVIQDASNDRSWRVRLTVAKEFKRLCEAFGPNITASHLMDCHKMLLKDQELEVRKEALLVIQECIENKCITVDQLNAFIIPQFSQLEIDSAQQVRAALAKAIGPIVVALGRDTTQRLLLPIISNLMKDEYHEVRLNIVSHAATFCNVLSVDTTVHSILHTIQSLIMDNHWRIRQAVVQQVPQLGKLFGPDMFQSKLEALFISSLRDSVYQVRDTAIEKLKEIVTAFGQQWSVEHLIPKILEQYSQSNGYAGRVTTLRALPHVCSQLTPQQICNVVYPLLEKASSDSVPNVRFCACKSLTQIIQEHAEVTKIKRDDLKKVFDILCNDSDCDVKYYAQVALGKLK